MRLHKYKKDKQFCLSFFLCHTEHLILRGESEAFGKFRSVFEAVSRFQRYMVAAAIGARRETLGMFINSYNSFFKIERK